MWDLSSSTKMDPVPPAMEVQSLNHWTTRKVSLFKFLFYFTFFHLFLLVEGDYFTIL